MKEFDMVSLTCDLPENGLEKGDVGTVVLVHGDEAGYEVEFCAFDGTPVGVVTLGSGALEPVGSGQIMHVRPLVSG